MDRAGGVRYGLMPRDIHDHYFRQAKREGYLSRAAYKLIEIDDRKKILGKGDRVLDCGAAPGSWLQVTSKRVGPGGIVVGVDLKPITHQFPEGNVHVIQGDLRELSACDLLCMACGEEGTDEPPLFNVVLSDMAPNTTGDRTIDHHASNRLCHSVLDLCPQLLRPGGSIVMKVFEGEAYPELLDRCRALFEAVKGFKPKASRAVSTEMYVTSRGYRGRAASPDRVDATGPPRRQPSTGWGTS